MSTVIENDGSKGNIEIDEALNAENGSIKLSSAKGLDIDNTLSASKDIQLTSHNGSIIVNEDIEAGNEITIKSSADITANADLTAGDYVLLDARVNGEIRTNGNIEAGSFVDIRANNDIVQSAGSILANGQDVHGFGLNINSESGNIIISDATTTNGGVKIIANEKVVDIAGKNGGTLSVDSNSHYVYNW